MRICEVIYLNTCLSFFKSPQIKITLFILLNNTLLIKGHYFHQKSLRIIKKKDELFQCCLQSAIR